MSDPPLITVTAAARKLRMSTRRVREICAAASFRSTLCLNRSDARGREVRGRDLTALIRSALICVCPPYPTWRRYWSNRLVNLARHGGLMASPVIEGMTGDGWRAGENYLPLPNEPAGIAAALGEIVQHGDRDGLDRIRRAGCEHAARLTYDVRCEQLPMPESSTETAAENVNSDCPD